MPTPRSARQREGKIIKPESENAPFAGGASRTRAGQSTVLLFHGNGVSCERSSSRAFDRRASLDLDRHQLAAEELESAFLALRNAARCSPGNADLAAASVWTLKALVREQTAIKQSEARARL